MACRLINSCCFEYMTTLKNESVDFILADPPYNLTRLDFDREAMDLALMFQEFKRIAKLEAPILIFSMQPFTTRLITKALDIFKYELIWEKSQATRHLEANKRPLQAHESILVFCKKGYGTYNPQKSFGEPKGVIRRSAPKNTPHYGQQKETVYINNGERYPRSVMFFKNGHGGKKKLHPTQKPLELLEYLVKTYSNEGDVVLDAFAGSGALAVACQSVNRSYIGVEKDRKYYEVAKNWLENSQSVKNA